MAQINFNYPVPLSPEAQAILKRIQEQQRDEALARAGMKIPNRANIRLHSAYEKALTDMLPD